MNIIGNGEYCQVEDIILGTIINKSDFIIIFEYLITVKWGPLFTKVLRLHSTGYLSTTNNQDCGPANPEVGRKISYN